MDDRVEEEIERRVVEEFPNYAVNKLGQVKYIPTGRIRANSIWKRWYPVVSVKKDGKDYLRTIHRFIAKAFIPNPEWKREVNHIDWDKTNNKVENLEWATPRENAMHARRTGLHKSDGDMAVICYDRDMNKLWEYKSIAAASRATWANRSAIAKVCRRLKKYKTAGGFIWRFKNNENPRKW